MKLPIRSLFIVLISIILACVIFLCVTEMKKESDLKQSTIDGLRKRNIQQRDSLESQLAKTRDSLSIAFATIRLAKEETQKAKEKSLREIRTLKSILFVQYTDSSRTAELKTLYPSWKQK